VYERKAEGTLAFLLEKLIKFGEQILFGIIGYHQRNAHSLILV